MAGVATVDDTDRLCIQIELTQSRIGRIAAVQVALHGVDESQWSKRAQSRVAKHRSLLASLCGPVKDEVAMEAGVLQGRWVLDGKYFQVAGDPTRVLAFYVDYQTRLWRGYAEGMLWNAVITAGEMASMRGAAVLRAKAVDSDPIAALGGSETNGDAWDDALQGAIAAIGCDVAATNRMVIQNAVHAAGVAQGAGRFCLAFNLVLGWLPVGPMAYVDVEIGDPK